MAIFSLATAEQDWLWLVQREHSVLPAILTAHHRLIEKPKGGRHVALLRTLTPQNPFLSDLAHFHIVAHLVSSSQASSTHLPPVILLREETLCLSLEH